ncbi:MAG: hypothetical protein LBE56_00570 [Tannerella sp.]|jgi:hypothetical protein|nr:hypothetical protein [Tannerella sp.]
MKLNNILFLFFAILTAIQHVDAQSERCKLVITDGLGNEQLRLRIEQNVSAFLSACNTAVIDGKKPDLDSKTTTGDARKRFYSIWETSPIGCSAASALERKCLTRPAGGYQIRDIPVTMLSAPESERNQEIVINLTSNGLIDDIFIPISQYSDLLSANEEAEDIDLRMRVLDFVENYRTAYNRRDIDFIETVFSNNAVIIVGKAIKQKPKSDVALRSSISTAQFEYQVKNKQQYITALRNVFKVNKYLDVRFDEITVLQHENYPKVYGVTLKQLWNSDAIKNEVGYVFLLIDFRDEQQPLIHVRTWQPDQYDGRQLKRDEIFQIGSFDLNRF